MGAEWWALVVSVFSVGMSGLTMWRTRRGRSAERLLDLHEKLRQLKESALEHLDVQAGEHPTETDVTRCREQAEIVSRRARWEDVRAAAESVFAECESVMTARARELPYERKQAIRLAIQAAFDTATETIGGRWGKVRG